MRKASDKINNFHLKCNKILDKELGQFDALVQFQEVALLDMLESQASSGKSKDEYVKDRASHHNIPLMHVPFSRFQSSIHQAYLIYPFACLDHFLKDWVREMYFFLGKPEFIESKRIGFYIETPKGDSYLHSLLKALKQNGIDIKIPELYINVYDYYRLSRNAIAHSSKDTDVIKVAYDKIDITAALKLVPSWPNAFKESGVYELDDLVVYAAFVKRIADDLSHLIYPHLDWTKCHVEYDEEWMAQVKKTKAKKDRMKTLQGYVKFRYGEQIPENQITKVMNNLNL